MQDAQEPEDGRHARRLRNRDTILDAATSLFLEGNHNPSADQIAERSQISARSLFRHFDTIDTLVAAAIRRFFDTHVTILIPPEPDPAAPFGTRVNALVGQRTHLYETLGGALQAAVSVGARNPMVAGRFQERRDAVPAELAELFAPELGHLNEDEQRVAIAGVHTAIMFESWQRLRRDHGLGADTVAAVMRRNVTLAFMQPEMWSGLTGT